MASATPILALNQAQPVVSPLIVRHNATLHQDIWFEVFFWLILSNGVNRWLRIPGRVGWLRRSRLVSRHFEVVLRPIFFRSMVLSEASLRALLNVNRSSELSSILIADLRYYGKKVFLASSIPTSLVPQMSDLIRNCSWSRIDWPTSPAIGPSSGNVESSALARFLKVVLEINAKTTLQIMPSRYNLVAIIRPLPRNGVLMRGFCIKFLEDNEVKDEQEIHGLQSIKELMIDDFSHGSFRGFVDMESPSSRIEKLTVRTDSSTNIGLNKVLNLSALEELSISASSLSALIDYLSVSRIYKLQVLRIQGIPPYPASELDRRPRDYRRKIERILRGQSVHHLEIDHPFRFVVISISHIMKRCPRLRVLNLASVLLVLENNVSGNGIQLSEPWELSCATPKNLCYLGDVEVRDEDELNEVYSVLRRLEPVHTVAIVMMNGFWFNDWEERSVTLIRPDYDKVLAMMQTLQREII